MDIKQQYEHSQLGDYLFSLCADWTKKLTNNKNLYYAISCTWGCIMTLIGFIVAGILYVSKLCGANITFEKYNWMICIKVGPDYWGGCSLGLVFLRDQKSNDNYINSHEFGHSFQNNLLGPLFPFIVAIPSAIRWWVRELKPDNNWPEYNAVWFEDSATQCGEYANLYLNKK